MGSIGIFTAVDPTDGASVKSWAAALPFSIVSQPEGKSARG